MKISNSSFSLLRLASCSLVLLFPAAGIAQTASQAGATSSVVQTIPLPKAGGIIQPALDNVAHALSSVNIKKWKAPGDLRSSASQDAQSIQNDLSGTLPGLISAADSASNSIAPSFAVYRNVDALYDVLLRVTETARHSAPKAETGNLEYALSQLESARTTLGDGILNAAKQHDTQLVNLQTALSAAAAHTAHPASNHIVEDGPAPKAKKKRRVVHHPAAQTPKPPPPAQPQ